jgi:hypothetical protein
MKALSIGDCRLPIGRSTTVTLQSEGLVLKRQSAIGNRQLAMDELGN